MSRKSRHLCILEDSKKEEFNFDKPSKTPSKLRTIIHNSREDDYKMTCNLYAVSMGYAPPNKLSYEK